MSSEGGNSLAHKVSIKLEKAAKGYRIHAHCYGNTIDEVCDLNIQAIEKQKEKLLAKKIAVEKMEIELDGQ